MKLHPSSSLASLALAFLQLALGGALAQIPATVPWNYILLQGSQIIDDCPVCGRPTIMVPLQGSFQLRLVEQNPLFSTYALEHTALSGGYPGGNTFQITGQGAYQVGGEVALLQDMFLDAQVTENQVQKECYFTAADTLTRAWPMLQLTLSQTNGTFLQLYTITLVAAPVRDLWFSTASGFTPATLAGATKRVSGGDLVSCLGRVVKLNTTLTQSLGFMPLVPDVGLDAVDVRPGGEMVFSTEVAMFSERLGRNIQPGDLLSTRGSVVADNPTLLAAFDIQSPPADAGLDAVQVRDNGEIYFSVQSNLFSKALGKPLGHGDLLSNKGYIVKSNSDLLARFDLLNPKPDYGLDAVFVWPGGGETWFSVAEGFQYTDPAGALVTVTAGDLLSDSGTVIFGNLDLLAAFAPIEDLSNFGLDALFVVTDAAPAPAAQPALRLATPSAFPAAATLSFQWPPPAGRLFQVEKAASPSGPFQPFGPIGTDLWFDDVGALGQAPAAFYRLRQW